MFETLVHLLDDWSPFDLELQTYNWTTPKLRSSQDSLFICLLDVSGSMDESDYPPTRLGAGRAALLEFAKKRRLNFPNDWLSVITFESESKIICPPIRLGDNPEQQVLKRSLSKIRSGGGTRLDYGLMLTRKCLHRLGNRIKSNGANQIRNLILTDGHSAGNPEKTAILLKSEGVIIEIIGIGGSPAEVNEKLLKRCASVENGKLLYRFIGDGNSEALVEHFGRLALG